jgi:RNA polymerase sigma-70 factor (ECF subfamily)
VHQLYEKSGADRYGLTSPQFADLLVAIGEKYLQPDASHHERRTLYTSLHVEELVLARACAAGNELAWQDFMIRYREKLHETAFRITREDSKARELAGSIYAELYGTSSRDGKRISKLSYYNGRGSLDGWLRTVMAQGQINEYRSARNTVSLDQETEAGRQFALAAPEVTPASDPRLCSATDEALAALSAEDRCILAYYFIDGLTLARTASLLRVHESTISRRLEKLVKSLRKDIILRLTRKGLSRRQAEEALQTDVRDLALDVRQRLTQDSPMPPFSSKKLSALGRDRNNARGQ